MQGLCSLPMPRITRACGSNFKLNFLLNWLTNLARKLFVFLLFSIEKGCTAGNEWTSSSKTLANVDCFKRILEPLGLYHENLICSDVHHGSWKLKYRILLLWQLKVTSYVTFQSNQLFSENKSWAKKVKITTLEKNARGCFSRSKSYRQIDCLLQSWKSEGGHFSDKADNPTQANFF